MKIRCEAQTMEECPGNGSNVKRMDGRIANEEEAKEWGQIELEATLIGARKASKIKKEREPTLTLGPQSVSRSTRSFPF